MILQQVYFDTAKDVIQKRSFQVLDSVAYALKIHPNIKKVLIEGHTDDRGSRDKNVDLSKRRASSVMRFLIGKGIEGERLQAEGYGPDKPIASNKTSAGRQLNRRVVFTILDPAPKSAAPAPAPAQ